jgi:hypothetical protein
MDELKQNYELRVHEEEESYERRLADIRGENDAKVKGASEPNIYIYFIGNRLILANFS